MLEFNLDDDFIKHLDIEESVIEAIKVAAEESYTQHKNDIDNDEREELVQQIVDSAEKNSGDDEFNSFMKKLYKKVEKYKDDDSDKDKDKDDEE